ncbi:MAG: hypothetical protein K0R71_362 [Bacillales bacterium]|jgi:hypothetical protein|nr:hypothetical protein [Bacillales bacterium]
MSILENLKKEFSEYNTCIINKNGIDSFEIINPFGGENISVNFEDNEWTFFFSYQHTHFDDDLDSLIKCIHDYLDEKLVSIEFFLDGKARFGGQRYLEDINMSSGESLLKDFGYYGSLLEHFKSKNYCCKIRCWNNTLNRDIDFVIK